MTNTVSACPGYPEDTRFMHNYNPSGNPGYASNTQATTNTPTPPTETVSETFVVSKVIARTWYDASHIVNKRFTNKKITRYDYAQGYDDKGTLLNHQDYWYFKIEPKEDL